MKYLVMTIRKPEFRADTIPAHWAFLDDLRARGVLEQAGGFSDRSGGAYVLTVPDLAAAEGIARQDPLHLNNCSKITVFEWDAR